MTARPAGHRVIRTPGNAHGWVMNVVPPGGERAALAALAELFSPCCLVPLTGSVPNMCPECRTVWNVHRREP